MSSIHEIQGQSPLLAPLNESALPQTGSMQRIVPAQSMMEKTQAALSEVDGVALQETLEEMSLAMGSRLKDLKRRDENRGIRTTQEAVIELVESLDDPQLIDELEQFSQLGEGSESPLEQLQEAGIPAGKQLLLVAALLAYKRPNEQRRRRLERALASLMAGDEAWGLQLFGHLELGELTDSALPALKRIYQRSQRDDQPQQGIAEWLAEIKAWPDRQQRIRVLLRALSFDLSITADHSQQNRLAATINDLKRLLLFLGMEAHCNALAQALHLSEEQVLNEILEIIEQIWIYPEWLAGRLPALGLPEEQQAHYLRRLTELLQLLPEPCYKDADQKEQTLKALMTLQDQLDEQQ
ncbi:TyeA family type III secretion system gatekeeper subunit [unidentified bacterial endosymbiont]|uniref:TyeA family type III secretion system gatekeeper subunit n=1 Tax=unidentified bacterial endosymbiont TaxID=2355 RepID=UPI00209E48A3|nr:TyeA family type III secretion system gatekeeper subunit [unidentified bacterial endosymbiont]